MGPAVCVLIKGLSLEGSPAQPHRTGDLGQSDAHIGGRHGNHRFTYSPPPLAFFLSFCRSFFSAHCFSSYRSSPGRLTLVCLAPVTPARLGSEGGGEEQGGGEEEEEGGGQGPSAS